MRRKLLLALPLAAVFALLGALAGCAGGNVASPRSAADLTNPFLGPDWSGWLVGPAYRLATPEEVQAFLALQDDAAAEAFVQGFWAKRGEALRKAFEERAAVADRLYSQAGLLGHRSDRGAIYVLYGAPGKVDFDVSPVPGGSPVEVWRYAADAPSGLDGKRPTVYRFIKRGDVTVFYSPIAQPVTLQPSPDGPPL